MSASVPSPRSAASGSRFAVPSSPRRAPPVFNPAFTSAAGKSLDPAAFDLTRRAVAKTFKVGVHCVQFFVKRTVKAGRSLAQGPEYTPRGTYVGAWEADTSTQSTRGWSSKRWGVGTQTYPDGSRYEGAWFDDKQNGEGSLFVNRAGSGASSSSSSSAAGGTPRKGAAKLLVLEYTGSWYNGKKHGFGKQTYPNGDVYEGNFSEGIRQGNGRCSYSDGSVYTGSWVADVRCGMGECVLPSGDSFYGSWEGDEKHGQGAFVYRAKGRIYEGEWVRGVPRAGEMRDFQLPLTAGAYMASGGASSSAATPMPPLCLADPQGVLKAACLASSGRLSGGEAGEGSAAGSQGGEGSSSSSSSSAGSGSEALDPGLTMENLQVLAAAFTSVDVTNSGFIPAEPMALLYILSRLNIDPPSEEDLAGLMEELVEQTPQLEREESAPQVSFQAFVSAMGRVKD